MNLSRKKPLLSFVFVILLVLAPMASAQEGNDQPESEWARIDRILRQMSDFLTSAQSFGFTAHELIDEVEEGQRIQYSNSRSIVVRRPNRLVGEAYGDLVNRSFWYDSRNFTLLDREFNTFLQVPAPDTIDALLDEIEERLNMVVPCTSSARMGHCGFQVKRQLEPVLIGLV
ncbi:MAG: DUF2092 domain-containing protein [Acidobacteria bacterium]|nr:DUF2092 domain-containing protein [Acidobacteriota bacterium]